MPQIFLLSGTTTWTVPDDCVSAVVDCIASGAGGASAGGGAGGGGAWARGTISLTPRTVINVGIGAGGAAGQAGNDTWFNATSLANAVTNGNTVSVAAQHGLSASGGGVTGGAGGLGSSSVGTATNNGGNGGSLATDGGGGGGAGGPNGAGGVGANGTAGNGGNGGQGDGTSGGTGGAGGTSSPGNGNPGTEYNGTHGSGGGGGGSTTGTSGAGGNYGGGGGGASVGTGGAGANGLIVINYVSAFVNKRPQWKKWDTVDDPTWQYHATFNLSLAAALQFPSQRDGFFNTPDDEPVWRGRLTTEPAATIQAFTAQKVFGVGGQGPTKDWGPLYNYDVAEPNLWSPTIDNRNSNIIQDLTAVKFFGVGGQAPTKRWLYSFDDDTPWRGPPENYNSNIFSTVTTPFFNQPGLWTRPADDVGWGYTPDAGINPLIILYTSSTSARAPFYAPRQGDETPWGPKSQGVPPLINLTPVTTPFSKFWRWDHDVGETVWTGTPDAAYIIPLVTAGGQPKTPTYSSRINYDVAEVGWGPGPSLSTLIPLLLTNQKFFGAGGQSPTKLWRYDYDSGETIQWQLYSRARNFNLAMVVKPFVNPPWVFGRDDSSSWQFITPYNVTLAANLQFPTKQEGLYNIPSEDFGWQFGSVARNLNLVSIVEPFSIPPWKFGQDDSSGWQTTPSSNVPLLNTTFPKTVLRPPFYVTRPSEDFGWQGASTVSALLAPLLTGEPFIYRPWVFGQDDSSVWFAKPTSSALTVPVLTKQPFTYYPWKFGQDDSSSWLAKPIASSLIVPILAKKPFIYCPWKFGQDDASGWQSGSRARNLNLVTVTEPFVNLPWHWKFSYDDASGWQGQPSPSALLRPLLTAGGIIKAKLWRWDYDAGESFWAGLLGGPLGFSQAIRTVTKAPLVYPPWRFGYDDGSFWVGAPDAAAFVPLLTSQRIFGAGGQVPTKLWRYDHDVAESFWVGAPDAAFIIPLVTVGGQPPTKRWRYDYDDSSGWQFGSKSHNFSLSLLPFFNPPWNWRFDYDDSSGWQAGSRARNLNLVQVPAIPPLWKFNYDDASGWQFSSKGSNLLVPITTAGGQGAAPLWKFQTRPFDDPFWQFLPHLNFNVVNRPLVGFTILDWNYYSGAVDDSSAWQWVPFRSFYKLIQKILLTDPRFIAAANNPLPSNLGAGRLFTSVPLVPYRTFLTRPLVGVPNLLIPSKAGASRSFVTTPTVASMGSSMPYGNDLSVIDPTVETVTVTFNFDPWLLSGVIINSVVSVTALNAKNTLVQDPNPQNIVDGGPTIGPVPPAFPGAPTGAANRAVLQQFTNCQPGVTYLLQCLVLTSDNQELNLATRLPCVPLN